MSEKMRDGFESWCLAKGYTLRPAETNCGIIIEGDYSHLTVQIAWQAWQASRAELVVELPSFENGSIRGYSGDRDEANMVVDAIAESLSEAGVNYK